jgi:hypothetical protein
MDPLSLFGFFARLESEEQRRDDGLDDVPVRDSDGPASKSQSVKSTPSLANGDEYNDETFESDSSS